MIDSEEEFVRHLSSAIRPGVVRGRAQLIATAQAAFREMRDKMGYGQRLPAEKESVAVPPERLQKVSAIFFDKVWSPTSRTIPDEYRVFLETPEEISVFTFVRLMGIAEENKELIDLNKIASEPSCDWLRYRFFNSKPIVRNISDIISSQFGVKATPVFSDESDMINEYKNGDVETIVTVLDGMKIIRDDKLSWEQVAHFREDKSGIAKVRAMRHLFDKEFSDQSLSYIQDALSMKIEDYENSLRKHGVETAIGSISDILDPKIFAATAIGAAGVAAVGGPAWGAIGGAAITLGQATLSVTKRLVALGETRRVERRQIALALDLGARR